jgi:peptidoglycan-associated lipoprotein
MKIHSLLTVGFVALTLAACGGQDIPDPDPEGDGTMIGGDDSMSSTDGFDDGGMGAGEEFNDFDLMDQEQDQGQELTMVIYFDFDQSELRTEYADVLQGHAGNLANDGGSQIRLEGHADERGSREYNIGLGERRSQSVRRLLLIQGASPGQISTVSFGEERPAAFGSDEEAYQLNRRVEIKYLN